MQHFWHFCIPPFLLLSPCRHWQEKHDLKGNCTIYPVAANPYGTNRLGPPSHVCPLSCFFVNSFKFKHIISFATCLCCTVSNSSIFHHLPQKAEGAKSRKSLLKSRRPSDFCPRVVSQLSNASLQKSAKLTTERACLQHNCCRFLWSRLPMYSYRTHN